MLCTGIILIAGVFACLENVNAQNVDSLILEACLRECPVPLLSTKNPESCYINHPLDCFKFVICTPQPLSSAMGIQVMPCAFGTKFIKDPEPACGRADLIQCNNDPCREVNLTIHSHSVTNCRTYWRCREGQSIPACCGRYRRFDPLLKRCVKDVTCRDACPLLNDVTCTGRGVKTLNYRDGNCKTYWNCLDGRPHPVCCPDGYKYDLYGANCTADTTCKDMCPDEYNDCSLPNVKAHFMKDDNCRTYMRCSRTFQGQAEPYCCRSGFEFDRIQRQCVETRTTKCFNDPCPHGFKEECRLEPVPNSPHMYKNLDAFGGEQMPCPVGTIFIPINCQCGLDPNKTSTNQVPIGQVPVGCRVAIHAKMPNLKNLGAVTAALLMIGRYGQGEKGVGNMTSFWDGDDGINIPYFGSQAPWKLYLEFKVRPTGNSPLKQILLSSCNYLESVQGQGRDVTLEISFKSYQNNSGGLTTILTTPGRGLSKTITIPYMIQGTYNYKLIYNGTDVGVILKPDIGTPTARTEKFSGNIPIDRAGLRLAKCRNNQQQRVSGFIGYVSEIKISKCVTKEMEKELASLP